MTLRPVINRSRVAQLIRILEQAPDSQWDMSHFVSHDGTHTAWSREACNLYQEYPCETTACIAGHILLYSDVEPEPFDTVSEFANRWLGIKDNTMQGRLLSNALFVPSGELTITREEAINALRFLYNTGVLHWRQFASNQTYNKDIADTMNLGDPIEVEWETAPGAM